MKEFAQKQNQLQEMTLLHSTLQRRRPADRAAVNNFERSPNASARFAHDFSRVPVQAASPLYLQPKLAVNTPGDSHEQEADRIAERVMNTSAPQLQRSCACGGDCSKCQTGKPDEEHKHLQTKRAAPGDLEETDAPPIVHEVLASSGQPLDAQTRSFMEPRFGQDFSRVRVHTDARAAESARAVNALAYTVGRDVVFGSGQYTPGGSAGRKLLAHELTHVVQQRQSETPPASLKIGPAGNSFEAQADSSAQQAVSGGGAVTAESAAPGDHLQRACGPAVGKQAGCIGRGGDITEFGGDSGKIFHFSTGCDDLLAGEKARIKDLAGALTPDDRLDIDGFASEEGKAGFNENLSCARAEALAMALIAAGVTSGQIDGIYMHGATPGERGDRRSAVVTLKTVKKEPEGCSHLVGSCDFYLCREKKHPCGDKGYYKGYGYKYCERFTKILEPIMSKEGKKWLQDTRLCLQKHIDTKIPLDTPCPEVKESAFDSHPFCYVYSGLCSLSPVEWGKILGVIDSEDNDMKQAAITALLCLGEGASHIKG
jgi:outer membrane protein OmpA-like peptidoglycan-associated protein